MRLFSITRSKQCCNLLGFGIPGNELTIFDQISGSAGEGKENHDKSIFLTFFVSTKTCLFVNLFKENSLKIQRARFKKSSKLAYNCGLRGF